MPDSYQNVRWSRSHFDSVQQLFEVSPPVSLFPCAKPCNASWPRYMFFETGGKIWIGQWFCPQKPWKDTPPDFPMKPQTKKHEIVNQKLLVKGPKYLPTKKNLQHRCRIFPWVGSDPWEFWSKSARANGTVEISKARFPRLRLSWEKCLGFCCSMIYLHFIAT